MVKEKTFKELSLKSYQPHNIILYNSWWKTWTTLLDSPLFNIWNFTKFKNIRWCQPRLDLRPWNSQLWLSDIRWKSVFSQVHSLSFFCTACKRISLWCFLYRIAWIMWMETNNFQPLLCVLLLFHVPYPNTVG